VTQDDVTKTQGGGGGLTRKRKNLKLIQMPCNMKSIDTNICLTCLKMCLILRQALLRQPKQEGKKGQIRKEEKKKESGARS
jgi:hypothetical protein